MGLQEALIVTVQLVIENNPGASKLKIVEAGGETPFENLFVSKLIDIVESEPTFSVSGCFSFRGTNNRPRTWKYECLFADLG